MALGTRRPNLANRPLLERRAHSRVQFHRLRPRTSLALSVLCPGWPPHSPRADRSKPSHEFLVNRLMNLVEAAKKAEKERTKPMLGVPDEIVANALAAAQRAL